MSNHQTFGLQSPKILPPESPSNQRKDIHSAMQVGCLCSSKSEWCLRHHHKKGIFICEKYSARGLA